MHTVYRPNNLEMIAGLDLGEKPTTAPVRAAPKAAKQNKKKKNKKKK